MVLYGLLCTLGIKGGLTLGLTAAELLTSYWNCRNSRDKPSQPRKVHLLDRRLHHGEIGTLLALSSLLLRATSVPTAAAALMAGVGMGLVKDDCADIGEWFRFKKKNVNDKKHTEVKMTSFKHQKEISAAEEKQYENGSKSEKRSPNISDILVSHGHEDKKIIENLILEPLQKQVRNLIDAQSQTIKLIELQIKKSQGRLQLNKT
jgi:hypothetical protein